MYILQEILKLIFYMLRLFHHTRIVFVLFNNIGNQFLLYDFSSNILLCLIIFINLLVHNKRLFESK